MKKTLTLILLSFLLFSCWEEEKIEDKKEKQDFFVKTQKLSKFWGDYKIKKTWKITSSQDIILSSKASGRISNISVKFWDKVSVGKNLISLSDSVANYWLNLQKTNLWIESSKLNYESTKISLNKTVSDLEINLDKVKKDYENLKKTVEQNLKSSLINLEQSKTSSWVLTTSSIQLDKIKNTIKKSELDYENLKKNNLEQIKSFEITSKNDYLNLKNLFTDIIDFSDNLLWVTDLNKRNNDKFEDYLGRKNSTLLNSTEQDLLKLIEFKKEKFDNLNINEFEINNLENVFNIAGEGYPKIIIFMDNLEKVLDNSIENIYFNRAQIDGYKSQINWHQTNLSWKYNAFLSFKSTVSKFLNTYKNNEDSNLEQINLLKKDLELTTQNLKISWDNAQIIFDKTVLSNQNLLNSLETQLKTAKLNLSNAKQNRDITLKQLNNSIKLSQNTKSLASKEYSKLFISSPISWVVSEVLVDLWQDVNSGTPLVKLSSLWKNEIEIGLSFWEIYFINIWDKVEINYLWKKLKWNISAISKIADKNLNYKAKISINSKVNISGNIVEVLIPVKLNKKLISLKNIKVKSDWIWEINVLENDKIKKISVKFWKFYWESVEILWCKDLKNKECNKLNIITNDVSNFDKDKFKVIKK